MKTNYSVKNYRENMVAQLRDWVSGSPVHNPLSPLGEQIDLKETHRGECCPDFSCCYPDLLQPEPNRRMDEALAACDRIDWLTPDLLFPHSH